MTEEKQDPMLGVCFKIFVHLVIRCQLKKLYFITHFGILFLCSFAKL